MGKQVKAFVDVAPYADVSLGPSADPAAVLASTLVTEPFETAMVQLAESMAGSGAPARIVSGPHGVGKSAVLTYAYVLARYPDRRDRPVQPAIGMAVSYLSGARLLPVWVECSEGEESSFADTVRRAFASSAAVAVATGVDAATWDTIVASEAPVPAALDALPAGDRLVLFVDGVTRWLRKADREQARATIAELALWAELAGSSHLTVLLCLDETDLDPSQGMCPHLARNYQITYLPLTVLAEICDRNIFRKEPRQRAELSSVHDDLKRLLPGFRWNLEQFQQLYPLHPATLDVAPAVRRYAPSFSFPQFAAAAGNRAKGRREISLVVLDEMFDAAEYEFRKSPELAAGIAIYDELATSVIPALSDSQQKFWGRVLLKGLFLSSLARRSLTAADVAATMLLFDERNPSAGAANIEECLKRLESRALQRFATSGEGASRSYRMLVAVEDPSQRALAEVLRDLPVDDHVLADVLLSLGRRRFPDWPESFVSAQRTAEYEVPWRGTWRLGLLSYGEAPRLVEIPGLDDSLPVDELAPIDICEYDWEVMVQPIGGAPVDVLEPPTLVAWLPGELTDDDRAVLRRVAALRSGDARLAAPGVDLDSLQAEAEAEGGLVFHRLYLEEGRFIGPAWETYAAEQAARETLGGLLARILDAPLRERYPDHPVIKGELDEATVRLLIGKFFISGARTPNLQQAAGALAAPLGLAEAPNKGPWRFSPGSEATLRLGFNAEPLRLAELAGRKGVDLGVVYQVLRRTPYGLQRPAQHLILAALVASGRVKLTGDGGDLTSRNLESAEDLSNYSRLVQVGLTQWPTAVLLEWCRLLTENASLNDLSSAEGRMAIREALAGWLARWRELDVDSRFAEIPSEAATRRTWQLISASRQFFETTALAIDSVLKEEVALEEGIGRIIGTFASNQNIYERSLRDLRMLTSFVEWAPTYTVAKEYVLSADRTSEPRIEAQREELVDYISAPHRLLDENKRRRFETVYEGFRRDYAAYYLAAHDLHVGARAGFEALDSFLDSPEWQRFELLSQVVAVQQRFYQLALELIANIRDLQCSLPTRELLQEQPYCACSFRLQHRDKLSHSLQRLKELTERGNEHHLRTIQHYRPAILAGMRELGGDAGFADASVPLMALLAAKNGDVTVSAAAIELINRCVANQPLPAAPLGSLPIAAGETLTKGQLRERLQAWLDEIPGEDELNVQVVRLLTASKSDE
jgi:hypothetical protein